MPSLQQIVLTPIGYVKTDAVGDEVKTNQKHRKSF